MSIVDDISPEMIYDKFERSLASCNTLDQALACRQWAERVTFSPYTPFYLVGYWRERMKLEAFYKLEKMENNRWQK